MIDELKCYEVLGVPVGVSNDELKAAHRDLAKVWHPDRFAHDPRLQTKAQEKLKAINEAYDQLTSGKAKRRPANPTPQHSEPSDWGRVARKSAGTARERWSLMLVALVIFGAAFYFTSRFLLQRSRMRVEEPAAMREEIQSTDVSEVTTPSNTTVGNAHQSSGDRSGAEQNASRNGPESALEPTTMTVQPMPTVTVTIDSTTGMIARRTCPIKSTFTYPKGKEPQQYCNVHMPPEEPAAAAERPKESSFKAVAKRLVSPGKWFDKKKNPDNKPDIKSP